jgi:hypothetical protein
MTNIIVQQLMVLALLEFEGGPFCLGGRSREPPSKECSDKDPD